VVVAPFGNTAFKEGFAGDVLTSTVRPLIDLSFSLLYFLAGVRGWASSRDDQGTFDASLDALGADTPGVDAGGGDVGGGASGTEAHAYYDFLTRDTVRQETPSSV
jgi:hypothetical protein